MNQTGTVLWVRLTEGPMTLDQLTTWAEGRFSTAPPGLQDEVAAFLDQLQEGELIVVEDVPDAGPQPGEHAENEPPVPWETPLAERFGELEQLILSGE